MTATAREKVLAMALAKAIAELASLKGRSEAWIGHSLLGQAADDIKAQRWLEATHVMDVVINETSTNGEPYAN